MPVRTTLLVSMVLWCVAGATSAQAREAKKAASSKASWKKASVSFLGPAREISHSSSASRDTAVLGMMILPRPILTAGGEFSLVTLRWLGIVWRIGFFGLFELESQDEIQSWAGVPRGDIRYWRGQVGYGLAVSFERLANRLCRGCALEATLFWRHESAHYTGSNSGDEGTDYSDRAQLGDFFVLDIAARYRFGKFALSGRLQYKIFIPNASAYSHGPGADLHFRWRLWKYLHPFVSVFGQYLFGDRVSGYGTFPNAYLVRGLAGIIVPSAAGDLYIFASGDVGHRKGLAVYQEEATLGLGVRVAFF